MKRLKKISILLAVLIVVCAVAFGVSRYEEHKEEIKNTDEVILAVDESSVTALSLEYDDTSLAFHKSEDSTWLYDADEAFPVDADKIDKLLNVFESFGASFIIENVDDFSQYGLDTPTCTIKLTSSDTEYTVELGAYSTMDSKRYVSIGDGNVYLSSVDPFDTYEVALSDMIKDDELPKLTEADSISFTSTDSENYDIYREDDNTFTYCADDIYFTKNGDEVLALDTSKIKSYLSSVGYTKHTDYVTYNATDEELSSYGFDEPYMTVNIGYTTTDEDKNETENNLKLDIGSVDEKYYLRINDSQIIYSLSSSDYETLTDVSYDSLRHDDIFTADFSEVYRVDVSLEEYTYTFTCETKDNKTTWYYNDEEISIDSFKSALSSLSADSFTDEEAAQKEEIGITLYLNNDSFSQAVIKLYRYDGNTCLAYVDGKPVALIPRSQAVSLIEAVNTIVLGDKTSEN